MSSGRDTDDRDNEDEEFLNLNQDRAFDSDFPLDEDNAEESEGGSQRIEDSELAAGILAYILRNRYISFSLLYFLNQLWFCALL